MPRAARVKVVYFTVLLNHRDPYSFLKLVMAGKYLLEEKSLLEENPGKNVKQKRGVIFFLKTFISLLRNRNRNKMDSQKMR
jgi:hypothetical protein